MLISQSDTKFINFLQDELALSQADIAVALKHRELGKAPFTMLLWQYGLVSLDQLDQIFDWLYDQHKPM
jgi:hypothetical protein